MRRMLAKQVPHLILRIGMLCTVLMLVHCVAARYFVWYITTLEQQILAAKLVEWMPEYALLCLTIAVVGAALTDVYRKRMM